MNNNPNKQLPADVQGTHDSDARPTAPSFDEMVEMIKKLFTDYLEDVIKSKPAEIKKSWERYKVLNHLYQDAPVIETFVPCAEDDPRASGSYTSVDGRSLCYVRESKVPVFQGAGWVKGAPKEQTPHYAKVPSKMIEGLVYKAIIIHKGINDRWWAVGDGFAFDLASEEIIEHLDESGTAANELQQLRQWKEEAKQLIDPIMAYAQGHKDAKLGGSCVDFILNRCKGFDELKAKGDKLAEVIELIYKDGPGGQATIRAVNKALAEWSGEKEVNISIDSEGKATMLTLCKDNNCPYCKGTGRVRIESPTTGLISYADHYSNGSISFSTEKEVKGE